tara:strand:- start:983 stop:1288 length:306 start_codon:yes stop_codon:yes gene_type:complete
VTAEFTFYALFIMLTISMGIVFQFCLSRIKKVSNDIKKANQSISKLHAEVYENRNKMQNIKASTHSRPVFRKGKTLSGNLELEYYGKSAQTKAIFYVDKES